MPDLKPSIHISGGNPAGAPDFRPLNPWGRGFPKRPPRPDMSLWVCNVEVRATKQRLDVGIVGPRDAAQMLCDAINDQIDRGKERDWGDPQVVRVIDPAAVRAAQSRMMPR